LGITIRETKPTGCEVYLHGLSLLLPKAVVQSIAGPLSLHGVQLLALNLTSTCLTDKE